ncbi:MAG: hypothetical protein ACRDSJ_17985, partial [Rubrobacteraceae bacterium]
EEPATRAVEHAMGESEVPEEPERIVSLSPSPTDNLVEPNLEAVAAAEPDFIIGSNPILFEENYDQLAEIGEELDEAVGGESATFLRLRPEGLDVYGNARLVGPILYGDLGLEPGPLVEERAMDEELIEISLERIPDLEADHFFVLDEEGEMDRLAENPLWERAPAVEEGNVYPARRDTWIASGVIAAEEMIEEVRESITQ